MHWPWTKRRAPADPPVLDLGGGDGVTLRDVYAGILIAGAPGSGKTTAGMGGLGLGLLRHPDGPSLVVGPAKQADEGQWRRWHAASGSGRPFEVFGPGRTFNFLGWLCGQPGGVGAAVPVLEALQDLATRTQPTGGDSYFLPQGVNHLTQAVRACWLGNGSVCVRDAHEFLATAAMTDSEIDGPGFAGDTLRRLVKVGGDEADYALDYWCVTWPRTCRSEKTAACIASVADQVLRPLMVGPAGRCLSGPESTFTPERLDRGVVLYLDFPVLTGGLPARLAQAAVVMCVTRHALSRPAGGRPIVLIQDEYPQTALRQEDARVAATGRSHRLGAVRVCQNLPQLAACLGGGDAGRQEAQALVGCHGTVMAFANPCRETNDHLAGLLGQELVTTFGGSVDAGGEFDAVGYLLGTAQPKAAVSYHQTLLPVLPPQQFLTLRTGGPAHRFTADCVVLAANRTFRNGKPFKKVSLPQVI